MRVLFVKLKNIGDSLLLTPTLSALRNSYPDCEIHVLVRKSCEQILTGCSAINYIYTSASPESNARSLSQAIDDLKLIKRLRKLNFDYAFELGWGDRGRFFVGFSKAKIRSTNIFAKPLNLWWQQFFNKAISVDWRKLHRAEIDFYNVNEVLPLKEPVPPLVFEKEKTISWSGIGELNNFALIHPTARWKRKIWQIEKWTVVANWALENFNGLVISTGPEPDEINFAKKLNESIGNKAILTEGKTTWQQLAWLLYQAKIFIGVDTAAMHLAAACQCPTVAIFGPTSIQEWHPWRVEYELVSPCEDSLKKYPPESVIQSIQAQDVIEACKRILAKINFSNKISTDNLNANK